MTSSKGQIVLGNLICRALYNGMAKTLLTQDCHSLDCKAVIWIGKTLILLADSRWVTVS